MQSTPRPELLISPLDLAFDFAAAGFATGFLAPAGVMWMLSDTSAWQTALVPGVAGALSGALMGAALPRWVLWCRRRPAPLRWLLWPIPGALWGGFSGAALGGLVRPEAALLGAGIGGIAGALQLGWVLRPLWKRARAGRSRTPLLLAMTATGPLLGALGLWLYWLFAPWAAALLLAWAVQGRRQGPQEPAPILR